MRKLLLPILVLAPIICVSIFETPSAAQQSEVRTGAASFGDWTTDAPGVRRKITVADLPPPFATDSARNGPRIVARPDGAITSARTRIRITRVSGLI